MNKALILKCGGAEDFEGPDFAVIETSPAFFERLLAARDVFERTLGDAQAVLQDKSIKYGFQIEWFDGSPDFYQLYGNSIEETLSATLLEKLENTDDLEWVDEKELAQIKTLVPVRMECTKLCVRYAEVDWESIIKHTDIYINTAPLRWQMIEEQLA